MSDTMYEENNQLLRRAVQGDEQAVAELIDRNMGLVKNVAGRFRDRGVEYEDLVQIGTIGMLRAVRSFDFSYGTVFSTYAVPLIVGEIRRFLRDDGPVKVGRSLKKQGIDIMRRREAFIARSGREPRLSELAGECGLTVGEVVEAMEAISPVRSLSEPAGEDDSMTLEGTIADSDSTLDSLTDRLALAEAIRSLEPLHRQIIALRYYRDLSQQQTGEILGLSQVKVSREEKKIMEKLRRML